MSLTSIEKLNMQDVISMMTVENVLIKCSAICELVRRNAQSKEVNSILESLKSDETPFWNNYLVKDFALSALHLLNFEKYNGERYEVKRLISSRLNFS